MVKKTKWKWFQKLFLESLWKFSKSSDYIHDDKKNSSGEYVDFTKVLWGPPNFLAADLWRRFERIFNKNKKWENFKKFNEKSNIC